ncbi:unnamed protein product [Rotaria magnacalcarata]
MVKVFVPIVHSFGENDSGVWDHDLSTPSVVYPLYVSVKSQGLMRIFVCPRTTILSSTVLTTILPAFDDLIEDYLKKERKNRFDDWYDKRNEVHITNSVYIALFYCSFILVLKL